MVIPRGRKAPNDWPADPVKVRSIVPSGSPSPPKRRVTIEPSIVPTVRLTLRTGSSRLTGRASSSAPSHSWISVWSSATSRPWSCSRTRRRGLPVVDRLAGVQQLDVADRLVQRAEAQLGEVAADLLGEELEEGDDELRPPGEPLAQLRVLGGDADRAGVQVADAHHHAAGDDQRRGREAVLLGAEQRTDDHVAAGLHLPVDLHGDPA